MGSIPTQKILADRPDDWNLGLGGMLKSAVLHPVTLVFSSESAPDVFFQILQSPQHVTMTAVLSRIGWWFQSTPLKNLSQLG
jgi:hypothetical protein